MHDRSSSNTLAQPDEQVAGDGAPARHSVGRAPAARGLVLATTNGDGAALASQRRMPPASVGEEGKGGSGGGRGGLED
jgi:hypothetical protein